MASRFKIFFMAAIVTFEDTPKGGLHLNEFILTELRRIVDLIPQTNPASCDYHILLQSLECFAAMAETVENVLDLVEDLDDNEGKIISVRFVPPPVEEMAEPEPTTEPETQDPEPTPFAEAAQISEEEPAKTYDMAEVRQALLAARKNGVDPKTILKKVGASNMSDLPPEKYAEVMALLGGGS